MADFSASSALLPGAKCATHNERAATGLCARCGDYLCGACGRRVADFLYCDRCAQRTRGEHSRRAVYALVLGLLSVIPPMYFLSPVALVLSIAELQAIEGGEAPSGGRGAARAGLVSSILGLLMPVSAALVFLSTR